MLRIEQINDFAAGVCYGNGNYFRLPERIGNPVCVCVFRTRKRKLGTARN